MKVAVANWWLRGQPAVAKILVSVTDRDRVRTFAMAERNFISRKLATLIQIQIQTIIEPLAAAVSRRRLHKP